jgi:replicative DNA helicase
MNDMSNLVDDPAEGSVIGGLMFNDKTDVAAEAVSILNADDFYQSANQIIWREIKRLASTGQDVNFNTVYSALSDIGQDYTSYVMRLANETFSQTNIVNSAKRVKQLSGLRKALNAIYQASEELTGRGDPSERMKKAMSIVSEIGNQEETTDLKNPVDVMMNVLNMMEIAFENKTGLTGISSGFENVDHFTKGFSSPDLIVVAAPPSMGKTTLSLNFAEHAAFISEEPKNVLVFSLEMSAEQLMQKTISNLGSLYLNKIKNGKALEEKQDFARIGRAQEIIVKRQKNFLIDDSAGLTGADIHAKARRAALRFGGKIDLIVVDYLHKIEAEGENEVIQIRNKIRAMKNLAKKQQCPVIVLSQLNRSLTGRPEMKNLLGSSAIEQEADIIIFLYDEDYQGVRNEQSLTEVIIAKNRMGEIGSTFLQPELAMSRFADTQRLPAPKPVEEKQYKKRELK